jgi:hypothetical protein
MLNTGIVSSFGYVKGYWPPRPPAVASVTERDSEAGIPDTLRRCGNSRN